MSITVAVLPSPEEKMETGEESRRHCLRSCSLPITEYVDCHCRSSSFVAADQEARDGGGCRLLLAVKIIGGGGGLVSFFNQRHRVFPLHKVVSGGAWFSGDIVQIHGEQLGHCNEWSTARRGMHGAVVASSVAALLIFW
nr:hypothetical protein Itr_chr15CG14070 [Ipomoea trifida]